MRSNKTRQDSVTLALGCCVKAPTDLARHDCCNVDRAARSTVARQCRILADTCPNALQTTAAAHKLAMRATGISAASPNSTSRGPLP
jgi:hypothetical protein